ncbi:MAG: winged helix-turn-helix domain-containing protein [Terriglobales bacterium]
MFPPLTTFPMGSTQTPPAPVRFGVFEADLRAGELRRNGIKVRLQDLPFRMLTLLLARPGEVITRDELRQALWPPDVFVDFEQGISSAVMRLRDALNDSADNPIFIQTVERRGYRWIGPVQIPEPEVSPASSSAPEVLQPDLQPPQPSQASPWRKLAYALPVLALVLAAWIFRGSYRVTRSNAKPAAPVVEAPHHPVNHDAEDLYLKGRAYWSRRTPESLRQAVDAFNQAIARDPGYSDAYVGLSDSYNLLREYSVMPQSEAYLKAFAAAKKAIELDPQSSEAHATLAFVTFWGMWDAPGAEKEFRRAIELDPKNSKAHHWFATFLHALWRHDEGLREIEIARKLDPNSSSILADKGALLLGAGRREEGLQLLRQLEMAEPDFVSPHRYLRFAYFQSRDYPNYLAEFRKEATLIHDPATVSEVDAAARAYAAGGERGLLSAQLSAQKKLYSAGKESAFFIAQTEVRLGKTQEALKYLAICVQSHDDRSFGIAHDSTFEGLHSDPAFRQIVANLGLPTSSERTVQ